MCIAHRTLNSTSTTISRQNTRPPTEVSSKVQRFNSFMLLVEDFAQVLFDPALSTRAPLHLRHNSISQPHHNYHTPNSETDNITTTQRPVMKKSRNHVA